MLRKFNSQGQVFVPRSLPFSVSICLLGGSQSRMMWPHTACCSAPQRDATALHLYSLELLTSSPSLGLLDEYQEIEFKYNTQKCARAGYPPSRKPWLLQNLATKGPSAALSDLTPAPITAKCLLSNLLEHPPLSLFFTPNIPAFELLPGNAPCQLLQYTLPSPTLHGPAQVPLCLPRKDPQTQPGFPRK